MPGVEWLQGDLEDSRALAALVDGSYAVIHCAGTVRGARRSDFDSVNADGAGRLAAAAAGLVPAPRFLLMSSLAARMPELSHYAASKWRGEYAVKAAAKDLRWTILRPPAVYGPGDRELAPLFSCMARGFAPLPAHTHTQARFSLVHVDDLASAVLRWLVADSGHGRIFELDDGRPGGYDWDTVLGLAGRALGRLSPVRQVSIPVPILWLAAWANLGAARLFGYAPMLTPGKVREITHPDWVCDSHDFADAVGWRPTIGLESGLARMYGTLRGA
jgi:nucleoside-diphosphate-sugar epimerase